MRAGDLDRFISIKESVKTQGSNGEIIITWVTLANVWAKYIPLRGQEFIAAQQITAQMDATFRIRWMDGLTTENQISYDNKTWNIIYIQELGTREGLDLLAKVNRL
jgi:SPP1 family predicted phage head-tail adaptor